MEEELTALLASVAGGRRYWFEAPQGTPLPHVVLYRIDGIPGYTYQGRDAVTSSRVQANCRSTDRFEAKQIARSLIAAVDGYRGGSFQLIQIDSDGRDLSEERAGDQERVFVVAVDLIIHHQSA